MKKLNLTNSEIFQSNKIHYFGRAKLIYLVLFLVLEEDFGLLASDANTVDDTSLTMASVTSNLTHYHTTLSAFDKAPLGFDENKRFDYL